jgi:hypothetical protein
MCLLSACAQVSKGVAEAVLEQEKEDTRSCRVEGPASAGLAALLGEQERQMGQTDRQLKMLMIHGIGKHVPGYSGQFTEHLMPALGLAIRKTTIKEIVLRDPTVSEGPLGVLNVSRYTNKAQSRSLLFYELTWSANTEQEKRIIEFDDATEHTFRRASINALLKKFINNHLSDSLIFLGEPHLAILTSVRQSFCWMVEGDWGNLADTSNRTCDPFDSDHVKHLKDDDFVIVTHSLGSRIAIDTLEYFGDLSATNPDPSQQADKVVLAGKDFRVYMLANQLPLLEMGQPRAKVRRQIDAYCRPGGADFDRRILGSMSLFAFSDPNDILSYPIPPKFVDSYVDSRLCPIATNISINVAQPVSVFGLGEFADPADAHSGYDHDDRVIALIAQGIGQPDTSEIVQQRCVWLETTD